MNDNGTAEQKKTYYAVFIGNRYSVNYPYNEAVFEAKNVAEAKHKAVEYIRAWKLYNERILNIRKMSNEEYRERMENYEIYMKGGYIRFRSHESKNEDEKTIY